MSLARLALRLSAIEALKDKTSVKQNVVDSQIGAIDIAADGSLRTDQDAPFIAVYTEGSKVRDDNGRQLRQNGDTDIVFEFGISSAMSETNDKGESQIVGFGIPVTDGAMEFVLDCIGHDIAMALHDECNPWAEIWRSFSTGIVEIERKRVGSENNSLTLAAHQLRVRVSLLPDQPFGTILSEATPWRKMLKLMKEQSHPAFAFFESQLNPNIVDGDNPQRRYGLTFEETKALFNLK
ncbi:hypothetical protein [Bartonella sp. HY761]|uniref:hypothetical protein n=1 Tax=Bartonella sp. HY761 TaxID=2979330 RepID=UPI00220BA061|nr:hypothetical protein [Bartonella sp. HY761]UXN05257.1 hypothetical protein N6A79_07965 [Bartonella sp. HY761]